MGRIGLYGGTFNPPHIGHMAAAVQAISAFSLDRLVLMPTRISPHKTLPEGSASPEQRLEMLSIAASGMPQVEVSDLELSREGVSYTWQTVLALKEKYPNDELILLMGTDMFLSFPSWKHPDVILSHASLGVFYRGERGERDAIAARKEEMEAEGSRIYLADNPVVSVSSTELRRMIAFRCADSFLPKGVGAYIRERGLFGSNLDLRQLPEDQLEQKVAALLKPERVAHVLGCRDTAIEMAKRWGADEKDAARAGLLHDITKALTPRQQLTLCSDYGILLDDFSQENPQTLHALTGSYVAQRIFGENDAVVNAIRWHTTGKADMTTLEKIIYVADYMEPNRKFPSVERLRQLAFSDLDEAVCMGLTMTVELLHQRGQTVSPGSIEALQWLRRDPDLL